MGYEAVLWAQAVHLAPFSVVDAVFVIDTHVSDKDPVETIELCRAIENRWQIPVVLTTTRSDLVRLQEFARFLPFSHNVRPVCNAIELALRQEDEEMVEGWKRVLVNMGGAH